MVYDELYTMEPLALLTHLSKNYYKEVPVDISMIPQQEISELLSFFRNSYAYLSYMALFANDRKRDLKRNSKDKEEIEKATQVENYITVAAEVANKQYEQLSRKITILSKEQFLMNDNKAV